MWYHAAMYAICVASGVCDLAMPVLGIAFWAWTRQRETNLFDIWIFLDMDYPELTGHPDMICNGSIVGSFGYVG